MYFVSTLPTFQSKFESLRKPIGFGCTDTDILTNEQFDFVSSIDTLLESEDHQLRIELRNIEIEGNILKLCLEHEDFDPGEDRGRLYYTISFDMNNKFLPIEIERNIYDYCWKKHIINNIDIPDWSSLKLSFRVWSAIHLAYKDGLEV